MNKDTKIKVIIGAVLSTVVLLMLIYGSMAFGGNKKENTSSKKVSFGTPKLEKKKYEYNKRIDLINERKYVPGPREMKARDTIKVMKENPFLSDRRQEKKTQAKKTAYNEIQQQKPVKHTYVQKPLDQAKEQKPIDQTYEQAPIKRRKKRYLNSTTIANNNTLSTESIPCKIYGNHKVTNYSKIKARITKDVTIKGVEITRNTIVTGIVRLSNSKVNISFETIQYNNKAVNVNMKAYSRDGLEGIYIEGGVGDDVKRDAYDDIIDAGSTSTIENLPIVGSIIKSTLKNQNDIVYVSIPNDYTIYLKQ